MGPGVPVCHLPLARYAFTEWPSVRQPAGRAFMAQIPTSASAATRITMVPTGASSNAANPWAEGCHSKSHNQTR